LGAPATAAQAGCRDVSGVKLHLFPPETRILPWMMARLLLVFLVGWNLGGLPSARGSGGTMEESSDVVKKELIAVVEAQLVAFRAGDYSLAYGFAAPGIQSMFPPETFEKMVRTGYPLIAHSSSADYGVALDTGEDAVLAVRITGADEKGTTAEYLYTLSKANGAWKITGVSEVKPGGIEA
jgi:hypothetical protein